MISADNRFQTPFSAKMEAHQAGASSLLRAAFLAITLLASTSAMAFALGEVHRVSRLGERLHLEIKILNQAGKLLESSCVRLQKPKGDESIPWLQQGSISIRSESNAPALLINSSGKMLDPVFRIGLAIGCGQDLQRDYTVLLSPPAISKEAPAQLLVANSPGQDTKPSSIERLPSRKSENFRRSETPLRNAKQLVSRNQPHDRLVLSASDEPGEPTLRMAETLGAREEGGSERQRQLLRMEYRLLQALYAQTLAQLETTENLRKIETSIENLQPQAQPGTTPHESADNTASTTTTTEVETKNESPASTAAPTTETPVATIPVAAPQPAANPVDDTEKAKPGYSWRKTFIFLLLVALAIGSWFAFKYFRGHREDKRRFSPVIPEPVIDPRHLNEFDDFDEPSISSNSEIVSPLRGTPKETGLTSTLSPTLQASDISLSQASIASPTIDEHLEANPVMELAEIMLSFGRVKGAAQALQDFVDSNPEEALQPWIRLMDVYRIAGMRSEFERVAAELNQHFNVEIQLWDEMQPQAAEVGGEVPAIEPVEPLPIEWQKNIRKASTLEEAEHIADRVIELWPTKECSEFLDQLLRSNRGGLRTGFSLQVVEEILFLIELQVTIDKLQGEATKV